MINDDGLLNISIWKMLQWYFFMLHLAVEFHKSLPNYI